MLVRMTNSKASKVVPPIGVLPGMPALAKTISSLPNFFTASATAPFGRCHVIGIGHDGNCIRPEFFRRRVQRRLIAAGNGNPRALGHKQPCRCQANAAVATGNERRLVLLVAREGLQWLHY